MTDEEAHNLYDIAWQAYLGVNSLAGQLHTACDTEAAALAHQWADVLWNQLAEATGHPVPDGMKRP
jgi:hypothetical protein